jgi:hypothetical protein
MLNLDYEKMFTKRARVKRRLAAMVNLQRNKIGFGR